MRYSLLIISLLVSFQILAEPLTYPYQDPASKIEFPKDEGTHHIIKGLEWWYVVVHAVGETSGDKYSILVTHFNNQTRFFNVTNITKKTHVSGSSFGILRSQEGYLDLTHQTPHGLDVMKTSRDEKGELVPFQYEMKTHYKEMYLEAKLTTNKKPMMVGLDGYGAVGSSGHTWYYSLTHMSLKGNLTYQGVSESIHGQAWMDHQWGPFWVSPVSIGKMFESYEWFSVQLDNGSELMISNIYNRNNELPEDSAYGDIQLFDKDGHSFIAEKSEFTRTRYWQDPVSKKYLSMGWNVKVPDWHLDLNLTPEFEDQMVRFPLKGDFWEGSISVQGQIENQSVTGKAFGELVHSFQIPEIEFRNLKSHYDLDQPFQVAWVVQNSDAGNPLTHVLSLHLENRPSIMIAEIRGRTDVSVELSQYKAEILKARGFQLSVKSCSVDQLICGEVKSETLKPSKTRIKN